MTANDPISVLLLGYGLAGRIFHAPLIQAAQGLRLDAIVTANPERAEQARADNPGVRIYSTVDEALAGGHRLAVVGTPNVTHLPYTVASLEAGLDVVLDKPIAATAAAAHELHLLARSAGRQLIPFQNRRWDADFRTACSVAASGALGTVHRLDSQITKMRVVGKNAWRESADPALMGGQLYDLGAHLVDQALMLLGPVVGVFASARSVRNAQDADDDTTIILEHVSGAISRLTVSQLTAFTTPRIQLSGTRGGLRIDDYDVQEPVLVSGMRPHTGQAGIDAWGDQGGFALLRTFDDDSVMTETAVPMERGMWPAYYDGVARCLLEGAEPPVLIDDVVSNMRVIDAARESAATGTAIRLDPPAGHRAAAIA